MARLKLCYYFKFKGGDDVTILNFEKKEQRKNALVLVALVLVELVLVVLVELGLDELGQGVAYTARGLGWVAKLSVEWLSLAWLR